MSNKLRIKNCPTCGSDQIRLVVRDLERQYKGFAYRVPSVEFYECPVCGERIFDHETMSKIEACSPAYRKVEEPA